MVQSWAHSPSEQALAAAPNIHRRAFRFGANRTFIAARRSCSWCST